MEYPFVSLRLLRIIVDLNRVRQSAVDVIRNSYEKMMRVSRAVVEETPKSKVKERKDGKEPSVGCLPYSKVTKRV